MRNTVRRRREYTVKYNNNALGRRVFKVFPYLRDARQYALQQMDKEVELTNSDGMVLPLVAFIKF